MSAGKDHSKHISCNSTVEPLTESVLIVQVASCPGPSDVTLLHQCVKITLVKCAISSIRPCTSGKFNFSHKVQIQGKKGFIKGCSMADAYGQILLLDCEAATVLMDVVRENVRSVCRCYSSLFVSKEIRIKRNSSRSIGTTDRASSPRAGKHIVKCVSWHPTRYISQIGQLSCMPSRFI